MNPSTDGLHYQPSPFVGVFYRRPSQDAAPFVEIGDRVDEGQTVCIVEAMELMNEIEAEVAGVVAQIFVDDGAQVEFGQRLYALRT